MQEHSPAESAVESFARSLAEALKTGLDKRRCERLVLVAPPEFLGRLRSHLDRRTEKAVVQSLANDLSQASPDMIFSRLPRLNNLDGSG
jgi:protein required for attachment to host cells